MRATTALSLLLPALALSVAAQSAAAQDASRDRARPELPAATATPPAALRTLATYRFVGVRAGAMPAEVTVADSAGQLVARFRMAGGAAAEPMLLTVLGADLVLQGATPAGVLTFRLYGQAEGETPELAGRWWLAGAEGRLRGRRLEVAGAAR